MIKLSEIETKYGNYLVDEDKLKELLVKPKPKTIWDLKEGDTYYHISANFGVLPSVWYNDAPSNLRRNLGTAFLTEKEAEMEFCREVCETIMMKYGRRTFKYKDDNYSLQFDNTSKKVYVEVWHTCQFQGSIYFDTKELAKKAINEIGEERLKKYVFRIEE
jgi:hypothetical protein